MTDLPGWTELWAEATEQLGSADEVRHILEAASGNSGASWLVTLDTPATVHARERVREMVKRRLAGEPLQYVLGHWGFRQLDLKIDRRVLIPRPETEQVVEAALATIESLPAPIVVDLGTGSGAIALSIAVEARAARVLATDASADALEVASANLAAMDAYVSERVRLQLGSWYDAIPIALRSAIDLVVSNPPYVGEDERQGLDRQVFDWEPKEALFGGADGFDFVEHLVTEAPAWLKTSGALVVEMAPRHTKDAAALARSVGFASVEIGTDYSGRDRWMVAKGTA